MSQYPQTVVEVLDDGMVYPAAVLRAVTTFAQSNPWKGSLSARIDKFRRLNRELSSALGIPEPDLVFRRIDRHQCSGGSHYIRVLHRIVLTGRLSVVSFLHEWSHGMQLNEHEACRWSVNLFRRCFPEQYSRLRHVGHTLVRPGDVSP